MPWYRMPDGMTVHLKMPTRNATPPCAAPREDGTPCGWISGYQCDWKTGPRTRCDRHLCNAHAHEVAPDKHLCPEHLEEYKQWLAGWQPWKNTVHA